MLLLKRKKTNKAKKWRNDNAMKTCNSLLNNNSYQILFIYSFFDWTFNFPQICNKQKKKNSFSFENKKKKINPVSMVFLLKAAFIDMLNKTNASLYQNHSHSFPVSGEDHLYKWKARITSPSWYSIDVTCNILKWLFWGWIFFFLLFSNCYWKIMLGKQPAVTRFSVWFCSVVGLLFDCF